jgi:hypothetical protein
LQAHLLKSLEWESIGFPLVLSDIKSVKGMYRIQPEWTITIWRDEEYKLQGLLRGKAKDRNAIRHKDGEMPGTFPEQDILEGTDGLSQVILKGCVLDGFQPEGLTPDGRLSFSSGVHVDFLERKLLTLAAEVKDLPLMQAEWFLAAPLHTVFPRATMRERMTHSTKSRTGITAGNMEWEHRLVPTAHDFMVLETEDLRCVLAEVPEGFAPPWANGICIEYRESDKIPDEDTRKGVSELVSFALGSHLLPIGHTLFRGDHPAEQYAQSPWGDQVKRSCENNHWKPFQYSAADGSKLEWLINKLLPVYLEKRKKMGLNQALWKFWTAKELPVGVNLPVLSSGFDTIVNKYLKSRGANAGEYLPEDRYLELVGGEIEAMGGKLRDVPEYEKIVNKLKGAFRRGINEKWDIFFKAMDLRLGKAEKEALKARNAMVHGGYGSLSEKEAQKLTRITRAYQSLFNRVMLSLLDHPGHYTDYYMPGYPSKPLTVPVGETAVSPQQGEGGDDSQV